MKNAPAKTNAARLLDSLSITYELRTYEVDPNDLTAISVAKKIGLPAEQVFKTLLAQTNEGDVCVSLGTTRFLRGRNRSHR